MIIHAALILFSTIVSTMAASPFPRYNETKISSLQCIPGEEAVCPMNCARASCFKGCISGCYDGLYMDCDDVGKEEYQLCNLDKDNCKEGLKCVNQDWDECDSYWYNMHYNVGRCIRRGKYKSL